MEHSPARVTHLSGAGSTHPTRIAPAIHPEIFNSRRFSCELLVACLLWILGTLLSEFRTAPEVLVMLQTGLLDQLLIECADVSREASEARESDWVALVGCLADRNDDSIVDLRRQSEEFLALSGRLATWRTRLIDDAEQISKTEKHRLLADLRLVLTAIRVVAFDVGLHGRNARMTDCEIADLLGRCARLDCQLRSNIVPPLKDELAVTDTVAI